MKPSEISKLIGALAATLTLAACNAQINDDIIIPAGAAHSGGASTVNGDVVVGEGAVVPDTNLRSVNGSVRVSNGAEVGTVSTVNGAIRVGADAETGTLESVNGTTDCNERSRINGNIKLVNGKVSLQSGTVVHGDVQTVNGEIALYGAVVEGGVGNYNGGMTITDGSIVKGNLVVHEAMKDARENRPRIVIGRDSAVLGELRFERPVRLLVHDSASIGRVSGADVISFSGDTPDDG